MFMVLSLISLNDVSMKRLKQRLGGYQQLQIKKEVLYKLVLLILYISLGGTFWLIHEPENAADP